MTKHSNLELSYHQWTVADYHKLAEIGLLSEKRVELISGEIIDRSSIGKLHAATVNKINQVLSDLIGQNHIVSIQNPIFIDDYSEPEPDFALLKSREDFYAGQLPGPSDVLLIVEVADTTLAKDRQVKIPLYAEAQIPEYWIVNLHDEVLERYTEPKGSEYVLRRLYRKGDILESALLGSISLESLML